MFSLQTRVEGHTRKACYSIGKRLVTFVGGMNRSRTSIVVTMPCSPLGSCS